MNSHCQRCCLTFSLTTGSWRQIVNYITGSGIYLATMYNKCTAKSLDSGAGVRSRHSNSVADKMGMNTRSKHQNDVKEKKNRGKKKWKSKQIIGAASQSHWDFFQDFCRFEVWSTSPKSRALQCCFPVLENQMQWTLTLQLRSRLSREIQTKTFAHYPFIYVASQLGKCSLPAFYTDQLEVVQGCSDRGGI